MEVNDIYVSGFINGDIEFSYGIVNFRLTRKQAEKLHARIEKELCEEIE